MTSTRLCLYARTSFHSKLHLRFAPEISDEKQEKELLSISLSPRFHAPTSRSCEEIGRWQIDGQIEKEEEEDDDDDHKNKSIDRKTKTKTKASFFSFETELVVEDFTKGKTVKTTNDVTILNPSFYTAKPPPGIRLRPPPIDPNDPNSGPNVNNGADTKPQNQSFLQKYGMYLLIAYVVMSFLGGSGPETGEEGQGRGQGQGQGQASSSQRNGNPGNTR